MSLPSLPPLWPLARLAAHSLWNRRLTAALTVLTIATSVALLLGVERLRHQARDSFSTTISGTDLIVGARSGSIQLLLYSVFRIGNATNNITWQSYQDIARRKAVHWSVPLSLGDSHRGFRVMGTSLAFFKHYRYGRKRPLAFARGRAFDDLFDAVIGADVARKLGYKLGQSITIAHGLGSIGISKHDRLPFRISGILKPTGTPVDKTVIVSLAAIEAIHVGWKFGTRLPSSEKSADTLRRMAREGALAPKAITAALIGLTSKRHIFRMQRAINTYKAEPLLAILPGVALAELWELMAVAELALRIITWFVVLAAISGMLAVILASLAERRREMAILRANGARPAHVVALLTLEAGLLAGLGIVVGTLLQYGLVLLARPFIEAQFGLVLALQPLTHYELQILAVIFVCGLLAGLIPAYRAYRYTLGDGMMLRN